VSPVIPSAALRIFLLLVASWFLLPSVVMAGETRNVLVLYASSRLLPANVKLDHGLRQTIQTSADRPVALFDEFLDVPRFGGQAYARTVATYLRDKYAIRPPAVIVVGNQEALSFVLENRAGLFPEVPVVYMSAPKSFLRSIPALPADVFGVPIEYDISSTIDQALRWHPRARRLVFVTGTGAWDRGWEGWLRAEVPGFKDRATAEFLAGMPTAALLKRLGELGGDTVVFTPGYFKDGEGRNFTPRESAEAMAAAATAPVYGPFDTFIGTGVVGGYMPNYDRMGRQAGKIVNALLDGATPASLHLPEAMPTTLNVDWRQVRRWGIDEKAIPNDAVVHFKERTFWEDHQNEVMIGVAVFLLQAGLIGGLLVERRRRRSAEHAEQNHRSDLAHASRLAVAGELTASIAHEINQPLGAILSNADAADLLLASGADRRDEVRQILADIRRDDLRASEVIRRLRALLSKHQGERQPFSLEQAVSDIEPLLHAGARRRQATLDLRPVPPAVTVVGDRIQIQQVLINLVLNALDAVADVPEERRTVVVAFETTPGGIAIAVRDRGHGVAPEHMPKLFESFFSTKRKGMGMGLSITRTLVAAHGGRIWAENNPEEGAVFHVELPAGPTGTPSSGTG
jgi:signal transduction histidine kinase